MYGNAKYKLNELPKDISINPFNHTLYRKDHEAKKVVLYIKEDKKKIRERMCLSEHPFGTVKWHHGAHYLLCNVKKKQQQNWGLVSLPTI
jgi:transposase